MGAVSEGAMRDIAMGRGGSYSLSRDVLRHFLWDTRLVPTTATSFTYFTQPIGSTYGTGVKTKVETNLQDAGKLPNGQTFLIKRLNVGLISVTPAASVVPGDIVQAFTNIMEASYFQIKIAGREFDLEVHGKKFTPAVSVAAEVAAGAELGSVGNYLASGSVSLGDTPIFVDQLVNFSVVHNIGSAVAAINTILNANATLLNGLNASIQVALEGTLTRAK